MTLLAGFLDVVVRGIGLVAFSAAVGGVAFALLVLRPFSGDLSLPLLRRSLRLIVWGGVGVAVTQLMSLLLQLAALGPPDGWPVLALLLTDFGAVATLRVFLAVALAAAALSCFCFIRQTLKAGESKELPVVVRVNANVPASMKEMKVRYEFYPLQKFPGARGQ